MKIINPISKKMSCSIPIMAHIPDTNMKKKQKSSLKE